jgi:hypothetical protein
MSQSQRLAGRGGFYGGVLRSNEPLENCQMAAVAPSIFADAKHDSRSERYTYIPTISVLDGLRKEGFQPFFVAQGTTRVPGKAQFTKHMIRLRRSGQIVDTEANEIILVNSHDGTSSYQMLSGMLRFVCNNGLVCGENMKEMRVPHKGNIVDNVIQGAYDVLDGFEYIREVTGELKSLTLSRDEAHVFANAAMEVKYPTAEGEQPNRPFESADLLRARRSEDRQADIWTTFNRIQENVIKGGISGRSTTGRGMSTREVRGLDENVRINRALWVLAEGMANIKQMQAA